MRWSAFCAALFVFVGIIAFPIVCSAIDVLPTQAWTDLGGQATDVAVNVDTNGNVTVWITSKDEKSVQFYRGGGWQKHPGTLNARFIAAGSDNRPYVVSPSGWKIYKSTGSGWKAYFNSTSTSIGIDSKNLPWRRGNYVLQFHNGSKWVNLKGDGQQIEVNNRGVAAIIDNGLSPRRYTQGKWGPNIGKPNSKDIDIDDYGQLWIVGQDRKVYRHDGKRWIGLEEIRPGVKANRIAVTTDGVPYVVGSDRKVYYYSGKQSAQVPPVQPQPTGQSPPQRFNWRMVSGLAHDIGVDARGVPWIIGTKKVPGGYEIFRWNGNGWTNAGGGAERIALGPDGMPWIVNEFGAIYRWTGNAWQQIQGQARDIGIAQNGTIWVIGWNKVRGGYQCYRWTGRDWAGWGGALNIAVQPNGTPWVVNEFNDIHRFVNNDWQKLPGKGLDIGVGPGGAAWLIGTRTAPGGHEIFRWTGSNWAKVPGGALRIAVGGNGTPWVVNNRGNIFWGAPK